MVRWRASLLRCILTSGRYPKSSECCLARWFPLRQEEDLRVSTRSCPLHLVLIDRFRSSSQTPTLNARPIVRAIKQACRRGVNVTLFLDLGTLPSRSRDIEN